MRLSRLSQRIVLVCAVLLLAVQVMGLHYHRHGTHEAVSADFSVHLLDAGFHAHGVMDGLDHHGEGASSPHLDDDVEVRPVADSLLKIYKVWFGSTLLLLAIIWISGALPSSPVWARRPDAPEHPPHYVLRPPSNAPPFSLSPAR